MLALEGGVLRCIRTGYPYPDCSGSQMGNLRRLAWEYGVEGQKDLVYQDFVAGLARIFLDGGVDCMPAGKALALLNSTCGSCIYRGDSVSIYRLGSQMEIDRVMGAGAVAATGGAAGCSGSPVYLVLPWQFEGNFKGVLEIPSGYLNSNEFLEVDQYEGYQFPVLYDEQAMLRMDDWRDGGDQWSRHGYHRLKYAVLPAMGMQDELYIVENYLSRAMYPVFEWEAALHSLSLKLFLEMYGGKVRQCMLEMRYFASLEGLTRICTMLSFSIGGSRGLKRVDGRWEYHDPDLGAALAWGYRYFDPKGLGYGDTVLYRYCYDGVDDSGQVVISFGRLCGDNCLEVFLSENLMHGEGRRREYDCTGDVMGMLGVDAGRLSQLLLLGGRQSGIGKVYDYAHIGSRVLVRKGMPQMVVMLGYGYDVLTDNPVFDLVQRVICVDILKWMPDGVFRAFNFDRFLEGHRQDLRMLLLSLFGDALLLPEDGDAPLVGFFWEAFREDRLEYSFIRYNRRLVVRW